MKNTDIIELDLQGMSLEEAKQTIDRELKKAPAQCFRIRLIHGFTYGTNIRDMVFDEYQSGMHPRVIRVEIGWNEQMTELVLREYSEGKKTDSEADR